MESINVLSLFDGMSGGQIALNRSKIKVGNYYSSEIKPIAIKLTKANYPNTIHIGDVRKINVKGLEKIDLLIGGSPCQRFSFIGKMNGMTTSENIEVLSLNHYLELKKSNFEFDGQSYLFWEYVRILNDLRKINPNIKFLLENVKMSKKWENVISNSLGVSPILINSNLVSFQNRPRLYWTNISNSINQPIDKQINFQDYIGIGNLEEAKLRETPSRIKMWNNGNGFQGLGSCHNITSEKKVRCLTRKQDRSPNSGLIEYNGFARFLTRREMEAAQTVPYGYTDILSYNQAQDVLGDGWTIDVISHIFNYMKNE